MPQNMRHSFSTLNFSNIFKFKKNEIASLKFLNNSHIDKKTIMYLKFEF